VSVSEINRSICRAKCIFFDKDKKHCVQGNECTTVLNPCFTSYADYTQTEKEKERLADVRKTIEAFLQKSHEEAQKVAKNNEKKLVRV